MPRVAIEPIRVSIRHAAALLDIHEGTMADIVRRDVFTVIAPDGRGVGKRCYVLFDEVKLYAETADEMAVRDLRAKKGRRLNHRRSS